MPPSNIDTPPTFAASLALRISKLAVAVMGAFAHLISAFETGAAESAELNEGLVGMVSRAMDRPDWLSAARAAAEPPQLPHSDGVAVDQGWDAATPALGNEAS